MTFLEKLKEDHPDWTAISVADAIKIACPSHYGYEPKRDKRHCNHPCNFVKCWTREIPALKVNWGKKEIRRNMGIPECYTDGTEKLAGGKPTAYGENVIAEPKQVAQLKVIGDKEPECVGSYTTHTGNIDKCFNCFYRSPYTEFFNENTKECIALLKGEKVCTKYNKIIVGNVIQCGDHITEEEVVDKFNEIPREYVESKKAGEASEKAKEDGVSEDDIPKPRHLTNEDLASIFESDKKMRELEERLYSKGIWQCKDCLYMAMVDDKAMCCHVSINGPCGDTVSCTNYTKINNDNSVKVIVKPGDTVNVSASDSSSSTTRTGMIKDSGARREFESGAVRDIQEGKGRCDLLPLDVICDYLLTVKIPECQAHMVLEPIYKFITDSDIRHLEDSLELFVASHDWCNHFTMFLEVSKHFEEGAKKYGEYNWQKGIPTRCYIDSAVRHYLKYLRGDKDEPHDRAFVWNILCCIWTCIHKPELNDYSKSNKELDS